MRGKRICIGILAHVDAGKTTLSEALLYTTGSLRKLGRVDHGDAFLDNFSLERERGITIFSKQANLSWKGREMVLLDTPGHVDFSAEMERTLQVLDYCILVISGADGIQGHTATLWRLLERYGIPVFLFVNKMDQPGADKERLLQELQNKFGSGCREFGIAAEQDRDSYFDGLAMCSEPLMEEYLERGEVSRETIADAVSKRQVFPCYFGSALRLEGVEELLEGLRQYTICKEYPEEFGARVFKITRDAAGNRLTHLKVTGGVLRVKMPLGNAASAANPSEVWEEKADALRIYGGAGFQQADCVEAGGVCAVTGLSRTFAGQGLGYEGENSQPMLAPVLTYQLILPPGADAVKVLGQLRTLEEEQPELHVCWRESTKEIHVQVMGEVQTEVLKSLLSERFGLEAEFEDGSILYKETIATAAVGIGHFEPLRHYAEVHLLLEPGEPGSGITLGGGCSEDRLDRNWQRLIFTHLEEKTHLGVLTGAPLTDVRITLLNGRAHLKHTEGGDFRQATYRALRQGLMQCRSVLLEPVYAFTMELPTGQLGRAMSDVKRLHGELAPPVTEGDMSILTGSAPVASFREYQRELSAYTGGRGRLFCTLKGYEPCHNAEEVIESIGYDPEGDLENPSSSVFCAHGAGFVVNWELVPEYAHVESGYDVTGGCEGTGEDKGRGAGESRERENSGRSVGGRGESQTGRGRSDYITGEEIDEIFLRTYGKSTRDYEPYRVHLRNNGGSTVTGTVRDGKPVRDGQLSRNGQSNGTRAESKGSVDDGIQRSDRRPLGGKKSGEAYFLVDGYNIIFAWEDLRSLAAVNMDSARDKLMDICCNFQGYNGATLILVFDAYKVKGNPGSVQRYHNIYVVYTREAETADQYIEKTVHKIGKKFDVTVATSDALEQMIIWGDGALRLSAGGFLEEVEAVNRRMREEYRTESGTEDRIGSRIEVGESNHATVKNS
ncbi:MAG: NYN domain-containing protein [Acetatifactor sp.]